MNLGRTAKVDGEPIPLAEGGHEPHPHRVVTPAYLAEQLPASLISEESVQSLCAKTEATVVLDYRHPAKFIALGRPAAERHLEEMASLVTRREANHESRFAPESVARIV
jgi:hypothetical protein